MNDIADEAVRLAKRGKPVFPCNVEKRPYTANGFKEASTAEDVIRGWWARWPDALIGVPTGPVSGFVVLDVDVKDGRAGDDSLAQCQRDLGVLPDTVEALTPNGGRHLYFRYPKDCDIRCSAGQLGSGLDVRGDGGYVIAPPSVIHGRAYQWEASSEPGKVAVAELPAAWCARLARRLPTAPTANTDDNIPDGLRNTTLASLAGTMRRRGMSQPAIEAGLLAENQNRCKPPLPEEDVRRIAASVSRYEPDNTRTGNTRATQWPNTRAQEPGEREPKVELVHGSSVTPEQIRWLWPGYLARGKFHIIAGAPSTGKTTVALSFAATISAGQSWPDGTRAETGNVLIWSGEDDVRDTLLPRLLAMGADPRRIYFIGSVMADGNKRPFDPSRDMDALARQAACIDDVRLLIVDPIVNAVAGDSHKNSETRRSLQPVVDLATRLGAAALGVSHFSKGTSGRDPIERVTGSLAFSALPRLVFATARKTDEEGRIERLLVRAKSNIGPDGGGYGYDLQQQAVPGSLLLTASYVRWGQALQGEARELLATAESEQDSEEHGAMAEAVDWLRELLAEEGGKIDRRDVMRAALAMGYKERTVHRARRALNLSVVLSGFGKDKRSVWSSVDSPNRANPVQPCQPRSAARMDDPGAYGDGTGATSAEGEL